ncbi:mediator of RNA polymerase II transcription subunit 25 [Tanacetum coccineum]|uniref:Mediator of RNA polymerase II transcription subunit 25 n=1 Tax=Tanacetum coccineum TaxID=301880 RepID=A0ABQ5AR45_9ASTR
MKTHSNTNAHVKDEDFQWSWVMLGVMGMFEIDGDVVEDEAPAIFRRRGVMSHECDKKSKTLHSRNDGRVCCLRVAAAPLGQLKSVLELTYLKGPKAERTLEVNTLCNLHPEPSVSFLRTALAALAENHCHQHKVSTVATDVKLHRSMECNKCKCAMSNMLPAMNFFMSGEIGPKQSLKASLSDWNHTDASMREFCSHVTSTSTGPSSCGQCLLYLVVCGSPDPMKSSAANVNVTSSIESFLFILSELAFFDQGAPALEEGLACALKCFALTQEWQGEHLLVDRQCIQVTASEASSFVPLSVICRNGLPRMRDIYTAGNNFNQTYGDFAIEFEHPGHLILMSEKFPGSRWALRHLKQKIPDEPLISFKQDFTEEQLDMNFEMLDSEDSGEQPRDEAADVDSSNRQYLPLPEGSTSHFEVRESSGTPVSRKRKRKRKDMA